VPRRVREFTGANISREIRSRDDLKPRKVRFGTLREGRGGEAEGQHRANRRNHQRGRRARASVAITGPCSFFRVNATGKGLSTSE